VTRQIAAQILLYPRIVEQLRTIRYAPARRFRERLSLHHSPPRHVVKTIANTEQRSIHLEQRPLIPHWNNSFSLFRYKYFSENCCITK